jgi:hypothetical protein
MSTDKTERALLPCPFCGSSAVGVWMNHRVVCGSCGAEGCSFHDDSGPNIAAWNTRAAQPSQPATVVPVVIAWVHESDPHHSISAPQKEQALRDGGASASSVRPYSIAAYVHPSAPAESGWQWVPREFVQGFCTLAHNYSLKAVPPDYYSGTEGDAFSSAYRRCGQDLGKLRDMLKAAPSAAQPGGEGAA